MTAYTPRLASRFLKEKTKLPKEMRSRVTETMNGIISNPYSNGIRLVGNLKGFWKRRIGDYRIIYEIIENDKIVVFHIVEHRKKVYD
jgi:mRNA interferase RelE/StbE